MAIVEFVNRSGTMVIFFMTLYLTRSIGASTVQAGMATSAYGFGTLMVPPYTKN